MNIIIKKALEGHFISWILTYDIDSSNTSYYNVCCSSPPPQFAGSKKTMEGTLAAIVSQIVTCALLSLLFGVHPSFSDAWLSISWVVILTSLLEAFTSQIDNLVLPSFMMALLMAKS